MNYEEKVLNLGKSMRIISLEKDSLNVQSRYGPSKIVKLPLKINPDLSCFIAVVIGDGHLSKEKFRTTIESSNKELLEVLSSIINKLFSMNTNIKEIKKRERKKQTYHLSAYSKAVQELLSLVFNIPRGKKSDFVKIPEEIHKAKDSIKAAFVIGLLAAEGSRRGEHSVRICSASQDLLIGTKKLLLDLKIPSKTESWINKKYKKQYYSLSFKRTYLRSLTRGCRSGQTGLILSIFNRVIRGHA